MVCGHSLYLQCTVQCSKMDDSLLWHKITFVYFLPHFMYSIHMFRENGPRTNSIWKVNTNQVPHYLTQCLHSLYRIVYIVYIPISKRGPHRLLLRGYQKRAKTFLWFLYFISFWIKRGLGKSKFQMLFFSELSQGIPFFQFLDEFQVFQRFFL